MSETRKPPISSIIWLSWILVGYVALGTPFFVFAAFSFGLRFTELVKPYALFLLSSLMVSFLIRDARKYTDRTGQYRARVALSLGIGALLFGALIHYFGIRLRLIPREYSRASFEAVIVGPVVVSLTALYLTGKRIVERKGP
jgi:hypothetical protein